MQYRRIISAVLVPATLLFFTGCTKTVWIRPEQLRPEETVKVVVTPDGHEVKPDRTTLRGDTIYAELAADTLRLALNEVRGVGVKRFDWPLTLLVVVGPIVLIVAACASGACGVAPDFDDSN